MHYWSISREMGRVGRLFSRRAGHLSVTVDGKLTDPKTQLVVSQALPQAYHESACMVLFITSAATSNGSLSGDSGCSPFIMKNIRSAAITNDTKYSPGLSWAGHRCIKPCR